jgi:hypothetical protein
MKKVPCPAPGCDNTLNLDDDPPLSLGLRGICVVCLNEYEINKLIPLTLVPIQTEDGGLFG